MRISTIQAFNNQVAGLQKNYANVTRTQEQISTGKRILTPADDPVASVRLLQLSQEEALNGQYKSNITAAKNSLNSEEHPHLRRQRDAAHPRDRRRGGRRCPGLHRQGLPGH